MLKSNLTEWLVIMLVVMVICLNRMDNLSAQIEEVLPENSSIQNEDESQERIAYKVYRMVPYKTPEGELKYKRVAETRYASRTRSLQFQKNEMKKLIQQIPALLATAKTEDEKQVMKSDLKKNLLDYFEKELAERESKLKPLEDRVKKLRGQIDKRRAAKEEIVDLQLQLILNQAEGLGYFSEPENRKTIRSRNVDDPFVSSGTPLLRGKRDPHLTRRKLLYLLKLFRLCNRTRFLNQ